MIKINDLSKEYFLIKNQLNKKLKKKFLNSEFILGDSCQKFEEKYSYLSKIKYTVACANGTDAINIAIRSLNLQKKKIIVPCESWISSASMLAINNCEIIFCDTDKNSLIDLELLEQILKNNKDIAAVVVVHLHGKIINLKELLRIKKKYKIKIIEDCAQSHLGRSSQKAVGTVGNFATFSFFPGKNMGAMGDAGAICTNSKVLANRARRIARHGSKKKGFAIEIGLNSRMDEIQAVILNEKTKIIKKITRKRIDNAKYLIKNLKNNKVLIPEMPKENFSNVFHQFVIKSDFRRKLIQYLKNCNIQTSIHYPFSLNEMPAFSKFKVYKKGEESVSKKNVRSVISVPCHPFLSLNNLKYIVKCINNFN